MPGRGRRGGRQSGPPGLRSGLELHLDVRLLDGETAIASEVSARYRSDGGLLERVAVTYGLRRTDEGWKIFLSATQAPETVLRFR